MKKKLKLSDSTWRNKNKILSKYISSKLIKEKIKLRTQLMILKTEKRGKGTKSKPVILEDQLKG